MKTKNLKNYAIIVTFRILSFAGILLLTTFELTAQQYNVSGTAVAMTSPGCYRLTNAISQAGAVWNIYKINLSQAFDITLTLNFGDRPDLYYGDPLCGADGMSFILQPLSIGVYGIGSGVGFHGITPSVGVVMDTYHYNPSDPTYQHISINKNGDELHGTTNELVSYTAAQNWPCTSSTPACISDGLGHLFRFSWTPSSSGVGTMNIYFGFSGTLPTTPTLTYTGNIVANVFSGDPNVFWGVSGSTGGCWNIQTVCMTTISNFASDTTICVGAPVSFTNNSISGLPILSWKWNFGDGDTSNLQNPLHIYNNPGTYNVSLAIVNSGGFSSTMTHSIVVNPNPNVVVNSPTICNGDTAVLTANGAITYTWNNGLTPGAVKNVTPQTTTSYIVTGLNSWGCINKDTSLVTVNPLPLISLTPNSSICIGDTIDLTVGGANTYLWSNNQTLATISVSPIINTVYAVRATDLNACFVDTSVTVSMFESPQISFSFAPTPAEGCAPITITFTDESTPAIQSWLWDFGDGFTSTVQIPSHEFVTPGDFDISLTITTTDGCVGSLTLPAYVKVFENPIAAFTTNEHQFSLSYANLICNSTSSSANVNNWHWDFGNTSLTNDTSNIQNPTFQYPNQGTFLVWLYVTTIHGCSDSTSQAIRVIEDSLIFPNIITPNGDGVNDFLDIKNLENLESNKLIVFNRWGKKVYEKEHYIPNIDRWDGSGLADGTYYFILTYKGILQQGEFKSSLTILRK